MPVNEPVKEYRPGSSEKTELKKELSNLKNNEVDIPMYIGNKEVRTENKIRISPPHDHKYTLGYYNQGDGKDLGHGLEFKSEVQVSVDFGESSSLGMSYNHLSNASLGDKNPGANNYSLNFLKKF